MQTQVKQINKHLKYTIIDAWTYTPQYVSKKGLKPMALMVFRVANMGIYKNVALWQRN